MRIVLGIFLRTALIGALAAQFSACSSGTGAPPPGPRANDTVPDVLPGKPDPADRDVAVLTANAWCHLYDDEENGIRKLDRLHFVKDGTFSFEVILWDSEKNERKSVYAASEGNWNLVSGKLQWQVERVRLVYIVRLDQDTVTGKPTLSMQMEGARAVLTYEPCD